MPLDAGTKLGPYEILSPLGAGGMGEVYLATDSKLDRKVAIKVLPESMTRDLERVARFEREAKLLASLNHPNIAAIHGFDEADGTRFLVMEYVEGETLATRIGRGALPLDEALEIAVQIAAGVEAAHEAGVIHRDLKPSNVIVTAECKAKVLDFGLARAEEMSSTSAPSMSPDSPTITTPPVQHSPTMPGVILGTAGYMSPEQARGKAVDKRSDIFSFGCILFEMLSGERPFEGETTADSIGATLHRDPDWTQLPDNTPTTVRRVLRRCLEKDRANRLHDVADARIELTAPAISQEANNEHPLPGSAWSRRSSLIAGTVGLIAGVGVMLIAWALLQPSLRFQSRPPLRKFLIPVPALGGRSDYSLPQISPDGRRLVYQHLNRLFLRDLQRLDSFEIPGSENAASPFWSFDSRHVAFLKDKRLRRWPIAGGQPSEVCAVPSTEGIILGGAWSSQGQIYFAAWRGGIYKVPAIGGVPRLLLAPETDEVDFHTPVLLPDGRHLIAVAHRAEGANAVVLISLADNTRRNLREFAFLGSVVYSETGHVLLTYDIGGVKLMAVPFSMPKLDFDGEPFLVAAGARGSSVSSDGTLTYLMGTSHVLRETVWVDRAGRFVERFGQAQTGLTSPAIAPDGRHLAIAAYSDGETKADIWLYDLTRGTRRRLTSSPRDEIDPGWADNGRIFYTELNDTWAAATIKGLTLDEVDAAVTVGPGGGPSVSRDGHSLLCTIFNKGNFAIWVYDLADPIPPDWSTIDTSAAEIGPEISPDGAWIVYGSNAPGDWEVFLRRVAGGAGSRQISVGGGFWPFWSKAGDAIFYWQGDRLMEVKLLDVETMEFSPPELLFTVTDIELDVTPSALEPAPPVDVAPDGRFLVVRRSLQDLYNGILVVENWYEEFRER